jgi:hypothetical protein
MEMRGIFMEISESEGREITGPYQRYVAECQWQGWDNYHRKYAHVLHEHLPQNRSDLINREINLAAKAIFSSIPGVRLDPTSHGQSWIVIQNRVIIRFKKLDRLFRASWNHGTKQSRRISHQFPVPPYPPKCAWLNAGYIPNKLWSTIDWMYLVHPRSDTSYGWKISLLDDPQISMDFSPLSIPPLVPIPEPPQPPNRSRARWKLKEGETLPKEQTNEPGR